MYKIKAVVMRQARSSRCAHEKKTQYQCERAAFILFYFPQHREYYLQDHF